MKGDLTLAWIFCSDISCFSQLYSTLVFLLIFDTIELTGDRLSDPKTFYVHDFDPSRDVEEDMDRVPQDKDVKKKSGTQPKKYYKTLSKGEKEKRADFFRKQKTLQKKQWDQRKNYLISLAVNILSGTLTKKLIQ